MAATKIATCCYCGAKTALTLRGVTRHELCCTSCGAPLHVMKMMPVAGRSGEATAPAATPARPARMEVPPEVSGRKPVSRPGKRRKSKGFGRRVWGGIWDVIEDVVDEVFD